MQPLTTTSFAILGLLSLRPWSAYELTEFMKTSGLARAWPRAASSLYKEPKLLAAHGLVTVRSESHRGPKRAVYSITTQGRRALRAWLARPRAGRRIEDEGMLRISLGDLCTKRQLLAQIAAVRASAQDEVEQLGIERILKDGLRFPGRVHISALLLRGALEQIKATLRWCAWAEQEVKSWPDDLEPSSEHKRALAATYDRRWIENFLAT